MENKTILLVDDEPDILQVLKGGLKVLGFTVTTAANGNDAIIAAIEQRPDLIVLDVLMPDMDGGEVARKLQEIPETKNIPVIFLTGMFPKREERQEFNMVNGNIMLDKPYEIESLFIAIKKLLNNANVHVPD